MNPSVEAEDIKIYDDDVEIIDFLSDSGVTEVLTVMKEHDKDLTYLFKLVQNDVDTYYLLIKFGINNEHVGSLMLAETTSKERMSTCIDNFQAIIGNYTEELKTVLMKEL